MRFDLSQLPEQTKDEKNTRRKFEKYLTTMHEFVDKVRVRTCIN